MTWNKSLSLDFFRIFFATFPKNNLWNQLFQSSLSLPKVFLIILGTRSVTTLMTWILLVLRQPWILLTLPQNPALCKPNHYICHQQHREQEAKNRQWPPTLSEIPPHPIASCLKKLFSASKTFSCAPRAGHWTLSGWAPSLKIVCVALFNWTTLNHFVNVIVIASIQ